MTMFPKKIKCFVQQRKNVHAKSGYDWAFFVKLDDGDYWVVHAWENKPLAVYIENVKQIFLRSCDIYYHSLKTPHFDLDWESSEVEVFPLVG